MIRAIGIIFILFTTLQAQPLPPDYVDDYKGNPRVIPRGSAATERARMELPILFLPSRTTVRPR